MNMSKTAQVGYERGPRKLKVLRKMSRAEKTKQRNKCNRHYKTVKHQHDRKRIHTRTHTDGNQDVYLRERTI